MKSNIFYTHRSPSNFSFYLLYWSISLYLSNQSFIYLSIYASIYINVCLFNVLFRFDNIRLELDDVNECFELIKNLVLDR